MAKNFHDAPAFAIISAKLNSVKKKEELVGNFRSNQLYKSFTWIFNSKFFELRLNV
jgi:hypothetical protein